MDHKEKSELLEAFVKGVRENNQELLQQTVERYEVLDYITTIRKMQWENEQKIKYGTIEERERALGLNESLEIIKQAKIEGKDPEQVREEKKKKSIPAKKTCR